MDLPTHDVPYVPSLQTGSTPAVIPAHGQRRRWNEAEVAALKAGVAKFGLGNWESILADSDPDFDELRYRTGRQLKEKWVNLIKFRHITPGTLELQPDTSRSRPKKRTATAAATRRPTAAGTAAAAAAGWSDLSCEAAAPAAASAITQSAGCARQQQQQVAGSDEEADILQQEGEPPLPKRVSWRSDVLQIGRGSESGGAGGHKRKRPFAKERAGPAEDRRYGVYDARRYGSGPGRDEPRQQLTMYRQSTDNTAAPTQPRQGSQRDRRESGTSSNGTEQQQQQQQQHSASGKHQLLQHSAAAAAQATVQLQGNSAPISLPKDTAAAATADHQQQQQQQQQLATGLAGLPAALLDARCLTQTLDSAVDDDAAASAAADILENCGLENHIIGRNGRHIGGTTWTNKSATVEPIEAQADDNVAGSAIPTPDWECLQHMPSASAAAGSGFNLQTQGQSAKPAAPSSSAVAGPLHALAGVVYKSFARFSSAMTATIGSSAPPNNDTSESQLQKIGFMGEDLLQKPYKSTTPEIDNGRWRAAVAASAAGDAVQQDNPGPAGLLKLTSKQYAAAAGDKQQQQQLLAVGLAGQPAALFGPERSTPTLSPAAAAGGGDRTAAAAADGYGDPNHVPSKRSSGSNERYIGSTAQANKSATVELLEATDWQCLQHMQTAAAAAGTLSDLQTPRQNNQAASPSSKAVAGNCHALAEFISKSIAGSSNAMTAVIGSGAPQSNGGSEAERQKIGWMGEYYLHQYFKKNLPGYDDSCWRSGNRVQAGLAAPPEEPSFDFVCDDVDGEISGVPGTRCFIECKATTHTAGEEGQAWPISITRREWQLAEYLHCQQRAEYVIFRLENIHIGKQPRIAAKLVDPVKLLSEGKLRITGHELQLYGFETPVA